MDLAELKFVVDTKELETAATRVAELGTAVNKLNKPMQDFSKESAKASKELSKTEEAAAKAALAKVKLQQAQEKANDSTSKSTSVLERQNLILEYMAQGNSKGQASILATAKAAGALDDEMLALNKTLVTQRTLIGGDPFDKSIGLMQKLQNEYKTTNEVTALFNRNLGLTEKQMTDLAREKERLIALYGVEGRSLDGLQAEYDQLIQKSVMLNQANDARTKSMRDQVAASNATAKANDYLTSEMERVNRLTASNGEITSATNNKLIKFEQQLKLSGLTAEQQVAKLNKYKAALGSIQKDSGNRQVDYLSRALGPQITDIAVGLATGQAPLTILLQQGGQLRDQFALAGVAGADMGKMLIEASKNMVSSIKDVGMAIGSAFVMSIAAAGKSVVDFGMKITGTTALLDVFNAKMVATAGANSLLVRSLSIMGTALTFFVGGAILAAVASLGALVVAFFQVEKEQNALARQLTLTGASLGVNTAAAISYANSLNEVGVSTGSALKVIQEMAKVGGFVANEINMVVVAANNLKLANVPIEDTVKQFAKLKEKPVEALLEIARTTGMVAPEVSKLVFELVQQGKTSDAAAIAMKAYADVTVQQKDRLKTELTDFSLFMKSLSSNVGQFFDDVFRGFFRRASPTEELQKQIADVEARIKAGTQASDSTKAKNNEELENLKELLRLSMKASDAEQTRLSDQARLSKAYESFVKDSAQFATNEMKRKQELAEAEVKYQGLIKAGLITEVQYKQLIANINEKYKTAIPKDQADYNRLIAQATNFQLSQVGAVENLTKAEIALSQVRSSAEFKKLDPTQKKRIEGIYEEARAQEILKRTYDEGVRDRSFVATVEGRGNRMGDEFATRMRQLDDAVLAGNVDPVEEYGRLANTIYRTSESYKAMQSAVINANKSIADSEIQRQTIEQQYSTDFRTEAEKGSILALSKFKADTAKADAELAKNTADANRSMNSADAATAIETYKKQADAKKALAQDVYDREQYLLTDGFKRNQAHAQAMQDLFKGMGDAIIDFALTGKTSFDDMIKSMIIGLIRLEMQMQMTNMYNAAGGTKGIISSVIGAFTGTPTPSAKGNVFDGGLQAFAKGGAFTNGIVNSPTMFNMGVMGEAGPEAIMPLRRGSDGSLGVAASGGSGGNVSVQVINNSNAQATTNETTDSKGNRKIEVVIGEMTAGEISRSGSSSQKSIKSTFGIQPQLIRR